MAVLLLPWVMPLKTATPETKQTRDPQSSSKQAQGLTDEERSQAPVTGETAQQVSLNDWLQSHAQQIGMTVEDPGAVTEDLHQRAQQLTEKDIAWLETTSLNPQRQGDERFLAVELLVMNPSIEGARALGRILMTPEPRRSPEPSLENMIRARAIEGLGDHPQKEAGRLLRESLYRVSDRTLIERGERALLARKGLVSKPEIQDREALEKWTN